MNETEFVPKERWAALPVQPPAGALRARRRRVGISMIACTVWMVVVDGAVVAGAVGGARVWDPLGPFVLLGILGVVLSVRQARAQKDELARGYTTLPPRN
ncbi:hypothetical protein GCM10007170_39350 [Arthrobacter liuii]|uniref:Uncharacterized protein n=1 Tax=Arthrobacter liuii TaxID=1476996 RepID=A0ABQ2AXC0_9MICC|nr:hypothetical protein GCM10007170_39350 [Arthrobacter liuii]